MRSTSLIRAIVLVLLLLAIVTAAALLLGTEAGRQILRNPHHHGQSVKQWATAHQIVAPLVFVVVFTVVGILALPMWWLQILAGYGFGLAMGIVWSQLASTIAAVGAAALSRFLLANWFHTRIESHAARLRALDKRLGHNGLLVVVAVRLAHFLPAGLSNYAFGLTTISLTDVAVGTALGGIPAVATWVTIGAARHLLTDWRYLTALGLMNALLLLPLILRYLRPEWFRRFGIQ